MVDFPDVASAGVKEVVLDTETTGLRWWRGDRPVGIGIARRLVAGGPQESARYLGFGHREGNLDPEKARAWAKAELRDVAVYGLNAKFDAHMMHSWGVDLETQGCELRDVGHLAALVDDSRRKFSLDALGKDLLGWGKTGGEALDMTRMASHSVAEVAPYAENDVNLTGDLATLLEKEIRRQGLEKVANLEARVIWPVMEMERNACPIDRDLLREWRHESERDVNRMLWEIGREVGFDVSPNRPSDLRKVFESLGIKNQYRTETGKESYADAVLDKYHAKHPLIDKIRRVRKLEGMRSKYLIKYDETISTDDLLRSAFHQLRADEGGTISGRFSSAAWRIGNVSEGANVQQVMTKDKQAALAAIMPEVGKYVIRRLYRPGSGLFLSADAKQIEYRIFASIAKTPALLDAYAKNPDVSYHVIVGEMLKPFADISYKEVKNLNFALLYGAGVRKVAAMLGVDVGRATTIVNLYFQAFPDAKRVLHQAMEDAQRFKFVSTISGRRVRFPRPERLHKALNGIIQGTAADVMKLKLIELHEARNYTGLKMRMTVHDEVCGDIADEAGAERVREILNRDTYAAYFGKGFAVPILWDVATGVNWAEC